MSGFFYFRINGKHLLVQNTTVLDIFNSSIIVSNYFVEIFNFAC